MNPNKRGATFGPAYVSGTSSFDRYLRQRLRDPVIRKYYVRAMRVLTRHEGDAA